MPGPLLAPGIEARLEALDLDGVEANLKCVLTVGWPESRAYDEVLPELERRLQAEPAAARLHALKGKALSNLGCLSQAKASLERSLELDGGQAAVWSWLGAVHLLEGAFDPALAALQRALALDAGCAWAYFYRGAARLGLGEETPARRDLERSPAAAAEAVRLFLAARQGRFASALQGISRLRSSCPGKAWPFVLAASVHRMSGDEAAALRQLQRALALAPGTSSRVALRLERAAIHEQAGRLSQAEAERRAVLKLEEEADPRFHLRRSALRAARGDRAAALRDGLKALRLCVGGQQVRDLLFGAAEALEKGGGRRQADRLFDAALRRFPGDLELRLVRGQNLENLGRSAEARLLFTEALALTGPDAAPPLLLVARARALRHLGRWPEAQASARRAAARASDDAPLAAQALLEQARALRLQGKRAEAEACLERLKGGAAWGEASALLCEIFGETGRGERCREVLEEGGGAARLPLARLLLRQDRLEEAEALVLRRLRDQPGDAEALGVRARILSARGRLSAAADAWRRAVAQDPGRSESAVGLMGTLLRQGKDGELSAFWRANKARFGGGRRRDLQGLLEGFRFALLGLDFTQAARQGELLLDATRKFEHLSELASPFFREEFDFMAMPRAYKVRVLAALERHLRAAPRSAWGPYYRDLLARMLGLRRGMHPDLDKVLALPARRYGWMRAHVGQYYLIDARDFKKAGAQFRAAAASSRPGDWAAHCWAAETLMCQGRPEEAFKALAKARALVPPERLGESLAWKGELLLWSGRYAEALAVLDEALRLGARFAHCWKGGALVKLGRLDEALACLEKGISLLPHDAEARTWKAEALFLKGDLRAAEREALAAASRYPVYCSYHLYAVLGLARAALGDRPGVARTLRSIPVPVLAYVRARKGLAQDEAGRWIEPALKAILELSLGVRRGAHESAVWMRGSHESAVWMRSAAR